MTVGADGVEPVTLRQTVPPLPWGGWQGPHTDTPSAVVSAGKAMVFRLGCWMAPSRVCRVAPAASTAPAARVRDKAPIRIRPRCVRLMPPELGATPRRGALSQAGYVHHDS